MKFSNGSFLRLGETLETMKNRDLRKYTSQAHDRFSAKEIAMEVSTRKLNLTWDTMLAEGTYQELWDMYRGDGEPGLADAMGMSEREFASAFRIAGEDIKAMIKNHIGSQRGVEEARSSASDQAAKAGAYNGGKSLAGKGDGKADLAHKLKGDALQKHRDASVAKMDAEDEAAKKAQRDRFAKMEDSHTNEADAYFSASSSPETILAKYPKEWEQLKQGADIMDFDEIYYELFSYFSDNGDMPYGTQKARDGDPYQWINDELDNLGLLEVANVVHKVPHVRVDAKQHSLNELDLLAKNVDYINGPDGEYYKVSYRNTGTVTGGGHRQNDKANFVGVEKASDKEVKALDLDARIDYNNTSGNKSQIHVGHDIQGGTPFSDEDISVYKMDTKEYEEGVPTGVKTQLLRYITKKEDSRNNANRIEERVKWLANRKKS